MTIWYLATSKHKLEDGHGLMVSISYYLPTDTLWDEQLEREERKVIVQE